MKAKPLVFAGLVCPYSWSLSDSASVAPAPMPAAGSEEDIPYGS